MSGNNTSGAAVTMTCTPNNKIATLPHRGKQNNTPIKTSNNPNNTINVSNDINGNVIDNNDCTNPFAGLMDITFIPPNHTNKIASAPRDAFGAIFFM